MAIAESSQSPPDVFASLIEDLERLRDDVVRLAASREAEVEALPEERRESARNLLRYIAMRRHDLRPLQERLAHIALSSIGRSESNVLATLDSVLHNLRVLSGQAASQAMTQATAASAARGQKGSSWRSSVRVRIRGSGPRPRLLRSPPPRHARSTSTAHRPCGGWPARARPRAAGQDGCSGCSA